MANPNKPARTIYNMALKIKFKLLDWTRAKSKEKVHTFIGEVITDATAISIKVNPDHIRFELSYTRFKGGSENRRMRFAEVEKIAETYGINKENLRFFE